MANIEFDERRTKLQDRIRRFSAHKLRIIAMSEYAASLGDAWAMKVSQRMDYCHNYLLLHDHYEEDIVRLHRFREGVNGSCSLHLLCPMCAVIRAANAVGRYHERYEVVRESTASLKLYYVVLTVLNGPDLQERYEHVTTAMRKLLERRRSALSAVNGNAKNVYALGSVFAGVEGGAYSVEVKRGENSDEWHPHVNLLLLSSVPIDAAKLEEEWRELTRDSFITYCQEKPSDDKTVFVEVFKYALKFSAMELSDTWHAYDTLSGRRLMGSFGCFRGIEVPETAEECDLESPYVELFYKYGPAGYELRHSRNIQGTFSEHSVNIQQPVMAGFTIQREIY